MHAKHRSRAEVDLLRSELHDELVDREAARRASTTASASSSSANALDGQLHAHDRAAASAAYLEAALVALDVNTQTAGHGCESCTTRRSGIHEAPGVLNLRVTLYGG